MKDIIEQNYFVTRKRGMITDKTKDIEFIHKIHEEFDEFWHDWIEYGINDIKTQYELADVILTCLNFARHLDIDIKQVLKEKIQINRKRI